MVITDSFGRAWRLGQLDCAIGAAGLRALDDWRGRGDRRGRELHASVIAVADAVAAAADLVRGKDSGEPVVIVSGLGAHVQPDDGPGAAALLRRPRGGPLHVIVRSGDRPGAGRPPQRTAIRRGRSDRGS